MSRRSASTIASGIGSNSISAAKSGAKSSRSIPTWAERLGEDHLLDLGVLGEISATAMTRDIAIICDAKGLPNTFVPGRNLLFFTLAAAVAFRRGLRHLVGGMCETDYSGYPDCRDDTLKALQVALNLGMEKNFIVETPLMWLDKADTWRLAETLGGHALVDLIVEDDAQLLSRRPQLRNGTGAMAAGNARPASCARRVGRNIGPDRESRISSEKPATFRDHAFSGARPHPKSLQLFGVMLSLAHDLIRKVCNFSGSCFFAGA